MPAGRVRWRGRQATDMIPGKFSAVLLAAGRSTRMGRDKALLPAPDGRRMWERQRDVLHTAGAAEVFLSARPDQAWVRDTRGFAARLHDGLADGGPMVGITAALERTERSHVMVLAIDLPRMTPEWLAARAAACSPTAGVVARRGEFFEPLAAIYPRELRWLAWEVLARAEYSLQRLLAAAVAAGLMQAYALPDPEMPLFENWNERGAAPPVHA